MASPTEEVELEQKEPLNQEASDPGPSGQQAAAENKRPVSVTGNADVLTVKEFREKMAHEGAVGNGVDEEAKEAAPRAGFGGSWKCAAVLTVCLLVAVIFTIVLALVSSTRDDMTGSEEGSNDSKSKVRQVAVVVTDAEACSVMGKNILQKGGSAVDAAITSQLCIGLVNSQSSGLGGGFFMTIYDQASGTSKFLDARETAPLAANEAFVDWAISSESAYGINNTAVPGEVLGLWDAHQMYGKLPWADLFTPVIELAEKGYRVTKHQDISLQGLQPLSKLIGAWDIYSRDDGTPKREGDLVQNLVLANTFKALAENGSDEFYFGETARRMVDEIQELGGIITMEDLAGYSTRWGEVLSSEFGDGYTLKAPSMPSGGPILQFVINVMQEFNLTSEDFTSTSTPVRVRTYHRFLETLKFAFGLRSHLGDVSTPDVTMTLNALSSKEYAREIAATIRDDSVTYTNNSYYHVGPEVSHTLGGTSHVSILAANGDAVSSTTSVNYRFGSRIRSPATGLIYNNEMTDFSLSNTSPNNLTPGKRPLSSMCGLIVLDRNGKVKLVEGSAGSKRIISANAWIILSTLYGKVPLSDAVDERRVHCEFKPDLYGDHEKGFPQDILGQLTSLGNDLSETSSFSVVNAIIRQEDGEILAYADPRKGGATSGY